jgi:tetratricopeptide (TPR) repeat protein
MAKLARLPADDRVAEARARQPRDVPRLRTRYYAFLSYSHKDREVADWLHRELERFRVPSALAGKLTANGVVPRRLTPIFRDQHDLAAGDDLAEEIEAALAASQFLVVLCSPTASTSRWTNLEIESFKRTRPEGCVLAAVVAGEPFASDIQGREHEECFPPALRYKYDRRGHRTSKRAEPLAADFREGGEGKRLAFLKLVAGMLGVGLDELVQRETTRRQRRLGILAAASLAGMAVTSTLAVTAIQARDAARDQRREAEGLIGFMLGDLKDKLEPIGRLDALDGVGSRVLDYYQKEGTSDLTDASLLQRSRALSLMAEVATKRGDIDGALRLYREAMAGTGEAVQRKPDDPQRLFDHAQNVFYVGQIAQQRGDLKTAERYMREYKQLAERMIALGPDNMKWRMEGQYADANLGVVLYGQGNYADATRHFEQAYGTIKAFSTADPKNQDYRLSVGESLAWLADSLSAEGRLDPAVDARREDVAILSQLFAETGNVDFRHRLIPALWTLGLLYGDRGQLDLALPQLRAAVDNATKLLPIEPDNAEWREYAYGAHLKLARYLLASGSKDEAAAESRTGCALVVALLRRDPTTYRWRQGLFDCLDVQAQLAASAGARQEALAKAHRAADLAGALAKSGAIEDRYRLAHASRLLGDIETATDPAAAQAAWTSGYRALEARTPARPDELSERSLLLHRLGRSAEATQLDAQLAKIGYRNPLYLGAIGGGV